jgi:hypothetical protein
MAKRWKCARCSTENDEGVLTCSNCRMIRGGVVVPGSFSQPAERPAPSWPNAEPATATATETDELPRASADADADAGEEPDEPPPTSVPLWRRLPLQWIVVGALVAAGGIGGLIFNASRSSSGEITRGGDLTATDLRPGDCFDLKDPNVEEIDDVTALPCTAEHEYEMFWIGPMPEGPFPTEDAMEAFMVENCDPAFTAYIGKAYADSELEVFWLVPVEAGWRDGDRSIACAVYHPRIHRLTGSLKGSAR